MTIENAYHILFQGETKFPETTLPSVVQTTPLRAGNQPELRLPKQHQENKPSKKTPLSQVSAQLNICALGFFIYFCYLS